MPVGRGVLHPLSQHCFRRAREFINRASVRSAVHGFQDLKQTSALALIALRVQDAFAFEVDVIDERVASP